MKALYLCERAHRLDMEARLSSSDALIAGLKLAIEKLKAELYGQRSERKARLLDQMELQLGELEAAATEDDLAAEAAAQLAGHDRERPTSRSERRVFPAHLPRERIVVPAPVTCQCCGSARLAKLGEDVTETLEVVPRSWKVIQTVREKYSCRDCEKISQAPAPFHAIPRGMVGPSLLAMVLFEKYGQHQPLNRQAERYAREGVDLSLSTLADHVGAAAFALKPLADLIGAHVLAAGRLHGDDTTVPVLAKGRTDTGRLWVYVRDDAPFDGAAAPAAVFHYSRNRKAEHPQRHLEHYGGILQADAYSGYAHLYQAGRPPSAVLEAACWAHARRKFFKLADIATSTRRGKDPAPISPLALDAVRRIDAIFDAERAINGANAETRLAVRQTDIAPMTEHLHTWMTTERARLSRHAETAKAMDYMLVRWDSFVRFLTDGRICLTNNAAERALRPIALGRKSWLFAGSDRGGDRAALIYTLIGTAKLNGIDPQAWLADVLARIADTRQQDLGDLLPWNWKQARETVTIAA
jgi:transposase